jgi:NADH:ubiquinone oxidoreductase subunit 6 (subunit J)
MCGHGAHMWMCGAMIVGAVVIVLATGSPLAVLPVVGCILMLVVMMQMMGAMGRQRGRRDRDD